MRDPYIVLGVGRTASEKDIKSAYRKLAKTISTPTRTRTTPTPQAKFAEASSAYDFLSDKSKRARFDHGEIDADGNPKFAGFDLGGARPACRRDAVRAGFSRRGHPQGIHVRFWRRAALVRGAGRTLAAVARLGPVYRLGPRRRAAGARHKGEDVQRHRDRAARRRSFGRHDGRSHVDRQGPVGQAARKVEEGQQIRLKGQGQPSPRGGEPGDAIVTVTSTSHKQFRRDGATTCASTCRSRFTKRCLAARFACRRSTARSSSTCRPVSTPPSRCVSRARASTATGDLYVGLRIVLPKGGDPDLESLMRFWRDQKPYKVRD